VLRSLPSVLPGLAGLNSARRSATAAGNHCRCFALRRT
jgi:hypothetical protein